MSGQEEEIWKVSLDEEHWSHPTEFPSKEAAIAAAPAELDLEPGDYFWVGRKASPAVILFDGSHVLENMAEQMYDSEEGGEYSEDWLAHVPKEATQELEEALNKVWEKWLRDNEEMPDWFTIQDVEHLIVPFPTPPQAA